MDSKLPPLDDECHHKVATSGPYGWQMVGKYRAECRERQLDDALTRLEKAKELLTRAETELAYVQASREGCGSTMCASSEGRACIEAIKAFLEAER